MRRLSFRYQRKTNCPKRGTSFSSEQSGWVCKETKQPAESWLTGLPVPKQAFCSRPARCSPRCWKHIPRDPSLNYRYSVAAGATSRITGSYQAPPNLHSRARLEVLPRGAQSPTWLLHGALGGRRHRRWPAGWGGSWRSQGLGLAGQLRKWHWGSYKRGRQAWSPGGIPAPAAIR